MRYSNFKISAVLLVFLYIISACSSKKTVTKTPTKPKTTQPVKSNPDPKPIPSKPEV